MPGGVLLRDATYVYINWGGTTTTAPTTSSTTTPPQGEFTLREPACGTIAADGDAQ